MLARKEAKLIIDTNPRFINQELLRYFPQRTLESLKSKRKQQDYRTQVERFLENLRNPAVAVEEEETEEANDNLDEPFLEYLEALPRPRGRDFQEGKLQLQLS